jgi:anti-sigma-K factor RskA
VSTPHDARWDDAAGAYLLHAMPADEATAFEAHLDGCERCRAEVDDLRVAADALPASPMQFEPPPELKDRIMAVVNAEAELLHAAGARADRPAATAAVAPERPGRRRRWSLRPGFALAGAVAVLALGTVLGLVIGGGDGTRTIDVPTVPAGAQAQLIVRDDGHSTLVTDGMPAPGRGRVYQVWLLRGEQAPEPTDALFSVRPDGSASVDVPGDLDGVDQVLVTSEPAGGSDAPSREPVLAVTPA